MILVDGHITMRVNPVCARPNWIPTRWDGWFGILLHPSNLIFVSINIREAENYAYHSKYFHYNVFNIPPFRMEYRHLTKMRGTEKLLWNWNISLFQLLMDCLIYNDMKSYEKQWNTLPKLWNLLISIFHSSMEFHGIPWNSPEVPWNSMEFHGTFPGQKGSSMEFHGTLKVPWNLMPTPNSMEFHGIATPRIKVPWNSMEF